MITYNEYLFEPIIIQQIMVDKTFSVLFKGHLLYK